MARPRKELDSHEFEKLCELQCSLTEIAAFFDCSEDTVERWCRRTYKRNFAEIFAEKRCGGKISLRRKQFETAMEGSVPMLIFLGKNLLGQSDKTVAEVSVAKEGKLADLINGLKEECEDI